MKLYRLLGHGSLDQLVECEEPRPRIAPDQVLVRIRAVSLNARDLMMVYGPPPYEPKPGIIPLSDGAGEIAEVGSSVDRWKVGDRVVLPFRPDWLDGPLKPQMVLSDLGGAADGVLAEYVAIRADALVSVPDQMSFEEAACLPCAGVTAWTALTQGDRPRPGATVLVQGTGGVSIFALQIAKALGCTVIALTSSHAKRERLQAFGADAVIDYREFPDWDRAVIKATAGAGVDRIIEVGGAGTLPRSMACLSPHGEIALVGLLDNPMNTISPLPLMRTMGVLRGISVGSRAHLAELTEFMAAYFRPVTDCRFPFPEAQEAIAYLGSRRHVGKVVIAFEN